MDIRPLDVGEEEVWRALVRLVITLPRTLDEDLQRGAGLSLTHYIVMMRLSEAPGRQLRMSDLAGEAELSPSRMSRIIHNLEAQALVQRTGSSVDGRANIATLTDAGLEAVKAAWPVHLASARTIVFDHLEAAEMPIIAAGIMRVLEAAQQPMGERGPQDREAAT